MTLKKRHFTLIELLVVMGLIGLLVTIAVPSFTKLAKGKATPVAAEQIKRQIEQAQALAISNRCYVGLIIPNGSTTYYGAVFNDANDAPDFSESTKTQYYLASARPALLFKADSKYYFDHWAPDSTWSTPIENARIVKISKSKDELLSNKKISNPVSSTTDALASSDYWSFKSVYTTKNSGTPSAKGPCAIVFTPAGGLDASYDLYVAVAGCMVNNTTITLTDGDLDYVLLHIDRMSGKVSYYDPFSVTQ